MYCLASAGLLNDLCSPFGPVIFNVVGNSVRAVALQLSHFFKDSLTFPHSSSVVWIDVDRLVIV